MAGVSVESWNRANVRSNHHKGVMSLKMERMKKAGKKSNRRRRIGSSERILESVHGCQPVAMKFHETLSTPVPKGANFWKRAGDMSKMGE